MSEKLYAIKPLQWSLVTEFRGENPYQHWSARSCLGFFNVYSRFGKWWIDTPRIDMQSINRECDSLAHGQAIADEWYRERMSQGLVEVPNQAEEIEKLKYELDMWQQRVDRGELRWADG